MELPTGSTIDENSILYFAQGLDKKTTYGFIEALKTFDIKTYPSVNLRVKCFDKKIQVFSRESIP